MRETALALLLAITLISATGAAETASGVVTLSTNECNNATFPAQLPPVTDEQEKTAVKFVIKKLSVPHCKRGPEHCEICRKNAQPRWCLLDVDPPDKETVQRPVITLLVAGKRQFLVYDVIKSFASEEEARAFMSSDKDSNIYWDSD